MHVHKYKRMRGMKKGSKWFRCMIPECNHYIRKQLVVGKKSICWVCNAEFIITEKEAELARPHCKKCVVRPDKKSKQPTIKVEIKNDFLSHILGGGYHGNSEHSEV
jgi:transcription elongation factor Elf1